MHIQLLGVHNTETPDTLLSCALVDGRLALDAGALTRSLTLDQQRSLTGILLTHRHFDHIRDLATFGLQTRGVTSTPVVALPSVHADLQATVFNGVIWSRLYERPEDASTLSAVPVEPGSETSIDGYRIQAVPTVHSVPSCGYLVSRGGASIFFSGDTGPGFAPYLLASSASPPMMLIVESTYANEREAAARDQGHLTPALLLAELDVLNQAWGRLPTVLVVHRHPEAEAAMARQFAEAPSDWEIRLPEAATTWDI